jgi:hypothetical protein
VQASVVIAVGPIGTAARSKVPQYHGLFTAFDEAWSDMDMPDLVPSPVTYLGAAWSGMTWTQQVTALLGEQTGSVIRRIVAKKPLLVLLSEGILAHLFLSID